jgi:hypothetical protein
MTTSRRTVGLGLALLAVLSLMVGLGGTTRAATRYTIKSTSQAKPSVARALTGRVGPRVRRGPHGPRGRRGPAGSSGTSSSTSAEWATAYATIAGAALALLALGGAVFTIFENRRTARRRLTYEWIARIQDLDLIEPQGVMASFLRGGMRPPGISDSRWKALDEEADVPTRVATWQHLSGSSEVEHRKTVLQIVAFPNMLEALASMYNDKLLDHKIIKRQAESQARAFWDRANWWVTELRSHPGGDVMFADIERMLERLAEPKCRRLRR